MTSYLRFARLFFRPLLAATVLALLGRLLFVQLFTIPSGSMMPTLQAGDQILVTPYRLPWMERCPRRGDIIVFHRLDQTRGFSVKRVVGLPGDHLEIREGRVFVDGRSLPEPYRLGDGAGGEMAAGIVPAESYFVLGDHRADSIDSRAWGLVPRSAIVGRARLVLWSAGSGSTYQSANATTSGEHMRLPGARVRWNRVFIPIR